ncbi:hypothetical protein DK853_33990 [Klebsiella oxytoca]|nr:hypothetical protein DK853_33990 [Klebsiella oxytoca]
MCSSDLFSSDKEIFHSNPDGLQGKSTRYGGKKTGQTACSGCEYSFLIGGLYKGAADARSVALISGPFA